MDLSFSEGMNSPLPAANINAMAYTIKNPRSQARHRPRRLIWASRRVVLDLHPKPS
jgi:hypothetical protein